MANMRISSRVRAGARALTTPTRDLHRLEHEQHLTVITINQPPPVSSADLADSAFTTCARVHTPAAEWQTWACVDADTNFRRREARRTSGGSGASEIRGGGVGVARDRPHSRAKPFCCSVACGAARTFQGGAKTIYG